MKDSKHRIPGSARAGISRREWVERTASLGAGLILGDSVLARAHEPHDETQKPDFPPPPHRRRAGTGSRDLDQTNVNPYQEWLEAEGLPVYRDYHVPDLHKLELAPWKRMGALGAYVDLKGGEGVNDGYVCQIGPRGNTPAQRYLFEEIIYILSGEGETSVWNPGGAKQTVRWKAGSIVGPPLNTWRQHFNRGGEPARFLAITNAPVVIDLFHNTDFVFQNDYVFRDRYAGEPDYFGSGPDRLHHKRTTPESSEQEQGVHTWQSSFVPDARTIGLAVVKQRGAGNTRIELQLADNTMQAHISEFEVGTYKKAHRHGPGSYVVMLNGAGYTLMWEGSPKYSEAPASSRVRVDFREGSVFAPPGGWFHQHFNTSGEPARYLAATWGGDGKWFMRALGGGSRTHRLGKTSIRKGGNLVEYEDEDPAIREMFEAELRKSGVRSRMPERK